MTALGEEMDTKTPALATHGQGDADAIGDLAPLPDQVYETTADCERHSRLRFAGGVSDSMPPGT